MRDEVFGFCIQLIRPLLSSKHGTVPWENPISLRKFLNQSACCTAEYIAYISDSLVDIAIRIWSEDDITGARTPNVGFLREIGVGIHLNLVANCRVYDTA